VLWRITYLAFPNPEGWAVGRTAPGAGNASVIRCSKTDPHRRHAQLPQITA